MLIGPRSGLGIDFPLVFRWGPASKRMVPSGQSDRDAISSDLLRYRDERRDDRADIIDMLTMHPDEGRRVARLLGEIEAAATS